MPPLVSGLRNVRTVGVGEFRPEDGTAPEAAARAVELLRAELLKSSYEPAASRDEAQVTVSGLVHCRIVNGTARRPSGEVQTRTAEVRITFTGTAGQTIKLFSVAETPTIADKRRTDESFPDADKLRDLLLRSCVEQFVADISPRPVRVAVPRPVLSGSKRTRSGIDLLSINPARAIEQLTKAIDRDSEDAYALNALGFCSEVAGNLELALSSYMYAAFVDERTAYRDNMQRVHALMERKRRILGVTRPPKGRPQ